MYGVIGGIVVSVDSMGRMASFYTVGFFKEMDRFLDAKGIKGYGESAGGSVTLR